MDAVPVSTRGAKGVCDALGGGGGRAATFEGKQDDDYLCRTMAAGGQITITAISSSFSPLGLEEIVLEGAYANVGAGAEIKQDMMSTANTLFAKLQMDPPPGLALTIQNRSRSVVAAGRMRVTVDHQCTSAGSDCKISIHLKAGGRSRRRARRS